MLVTDPLPRLRFARLAAKFHGAQPETIVVVTGTNGKTSVVDFCRQLWGLLGRQGASIGTLGIKSAGFEQALERTTPNPGELHASLASLESNGVERVALEASGQGLGQRRLDGVHITAAAFTNLSYEHQDEYDDMGDYLSDKLYLFKELLPANGTAVVNREDSTFNTIAEIVETRGLRLFSYGLKQGDICCSRIASTTSGFDLIINVHGAQYPVSFPFPWPFQLENALCALGLIIASGESPERVAPQLTNLHSVRGRMERAAVLPNGASVYVDYAHTPDGLETVLKALRPQTKGRLHVLFSSGGRNRSIRTKRSMMGEVAHRLADRQIVTEDTPREECPASIRKQLMATCPSATEIADREEAISTAIKALKAGDVLLVAGRGHKQVLHYADYEKTFDDVAEVQAAVRDLHIGGME
uniref:UDP-N-acetylmuramoylalanyl-D-glutamate--2,6-diaminopimelate ligase n=1 Tax=Candidatus Kentrum sp. UNK TaxID=2126344 RepID=A0A451A987_9GAMM|nr:MAG: UDP-N-acetylmuramoylalanyl-D-glutamate--2,6-diaminopimelate ligase [Candidatus Kentron sp. UNK]VFK70527.1 MAG: UDP-N-acetylmuramoylalanyl-D-glutamate--2,6-diaminopimelate ligase [Candidatus Kentron sp. UNK]